MPIIFQHSKNRIVLEGECQIYYLIAQLSYHYEQWHSKIPSSLHFEMKSICSIYLQNDMTRHDKTRHDMTWHKNIKLTKKKGHSFNYMQSIQLRTFIQTISIQCEQKKPRKFILFPFSKSECSMIRFIQFAEQTKKS